jgi:hypothetical protein
MNAYDADVYITEFKGLMQYGDQMQSDLRYSPDCMNVETPGGVLQPSMPMNGVKLIFKSGESGGEPVIENPETIGTLMYLKNTPATRLEVSSAYAGGERKDAETQVISGDLTPADKLTFDPDHDGIAMANNTFLIAAGGYIYRLAAVGDPKETGSYMIEKVEFASNGDKPISGSSTFSVNRWKWCTYEYNDSTINYQVIIMTNGVDGVYMYGGNAGRTLVNLSKAPTPKTPQIFTCVARHNERIWGAFGYSIYYSKPFDCTNWSQDNANPANGGGQIDLPTWARDSQIIALEEFGDAMIAFTRDRAWKITGTDPSNIIIQQQFGNGCPYPETIANMGQYLIYLGEDSLVSYDGYQVKPFMKEATTELFRKIGKDYTTTPCGVRVGDKYVLSMSNEIGDRLLKTYYSAFELSSTTPYIPTATDWATSEEIRTGKGYINLIYDMTDGTLVCNESPQILSLCDLMPYALTYEPEHEEGETTIEEANFLCPLRFDSWENQRVSGKAVKWVSPWITFGRNDIQKGGFEMYFTPEVRPKKIIGKQVWTLNNIMSTTVSGIEPSELLTTEESGQVTFNISIQTEKKTKTKNYTVQPLTDAEIAAGKKHRMKRLHFGGSGRRFRLIIEVAEGNTIPWRLIGGIHIIAETDKD